MARVQDALEATKKTKRKTEAGAARLQVEWTFLLLDIGAAKNEVSYLHLRLACLKNGLIIQKPFTYLLA